MRGLAAFWNCCSEYAFGICLQRDSAIAMAPVMEFFAAVITTWASHIQRRTRQLILWERRWQALTLQSDLHIGWITHDRIALYEPIPVEGPLVSLYLARIGMGRPTRHSCSKVYYECIICMETANTVSTGLGIVLLLPQLDQIIYSLYWQPPCT